MQDLTPVLHSGTVSFLFTDIEGSTRLLQELRDRYGELVRDHRRIMRAAAADSGGVEVDTQGDAFFFSFPRARDAVLAAATAQRTLRAHAWPDATPVRVRMGLHTGEPTVGDEGYLGLDVVRASRICSAANGGQILLSQTTRVLLAELPDGLEIRDLGAASLKDLEHEHLFELVVDEVRGAAPRAPAVPESFGERLSAEIQDEVMREISQSFREKRAPRKRWRWPRRRA
jgi:class 3 adenylate cyclase